MEGSGVGMRTLGIRAPEQGSVNFFLRGQSINILSFTGQEANLVSVQQLHSTTMAELDNT